MAGGCIKLGAFALALVSFSARAEPLTVTINGVGNCGNPRGQDIDVTLAPGKYELIPVAGAFNLWGDVDGCDSGAFGSEEETANCDAGWIVLFHVRIGNTVYTCPPDCCDRSEIWSTARAALLHTPSSEIEVPGPGPQTVSFFLQDFACLDNAGSVIVQIRRICPADVNGDGFVDFFDADEFVAAFEAGTMDADFNEDGYVDFFDLDAFVEAFERGC